MKAAGRQALATSFSLALQSAVVNADGQGDKPFQAIAPVSSSQLILDLLCQSMVKG